MSSRFRILLLGLIVAACLASVSTTVGAADALDDADRAALSDAADLLTDLDHASRAEAGPQADSATSGESAAELLARGPALLRGLDEREIYIPPLARLALSGESMLTLEAVDASTTLPVIFATAADQLDDLANGSESPDVSGRRTGQGLSIPFGAVLVALAVAVALAGAVAWFQRRASRMEKLSLVDPLTGLANRRRLDQDLARFDQERAEARRPVSVAMIDVDDFKRFNDTYGHGAGDRALRSVSMTIAACIRSSDSVYRYGGEEFLVLLRGAPKQDAVDVCERVRLAIAGLTSQVTVSIGVATGLDEPLPTLTVAADEALYKAKADGRNCVVATSVVNRDGARVSAI